MRGEIVQHEVDLEGGVDPRFDLAQKGHEILRPEPTAARSPSSSVLDQPPI
jgi:hypothetical protein